MGNMSAKDKAKSSYQTQGPRKSSSSKGCDSAWLTDCRDKVSYVNAGENMPSHQQRNMT